MKLPHDKKRLLKRDDVSMVQGLLPRGGKKELSAMKNAGAKEDRIIQFPVTGLRCVCDQYKVSASEILVCVY